MICSSEVNVPSDSTSTACHVQDLLRVFCLPAEQYVSSLSVHSLCVSVSHFSLLPSEMGDTHVYFIKPVALHPDINPINYKICSEMQQQIYLRKVCNMNRPTLWPGWHGFDLRVISNATDEWCKRL